MTTKVTTFKCGVDLVLQPFVTDSKLAHIQCTLLQAEPLLADVVMDWWQQQLKALQHKGVITGFVLVTVSTKLAT